ncbi:4459_t:CDS:1, partial [Racocetra persica]
SVQYEDNVNAMLSNKNIIRSKLERLLKEKRTDWKRCNFVKSCLEQDICLSDDARQNKKSYLHDLTAKKNKTKQMSRLESNKNL